MIHNSKNSLINIVIIENDNKLLKSVSAALEQQGNHVVTAQKGKQGLALVFEQRPALVIIDTNLSDIDGNAIRQKIWSEPNLENTIVMVVADESVEDELPGEGDDRYLGGYYKGIKDPAMLLYHIDRLLQQQQIDIRMKKITERFSVIYEYITDGVSLLEVIEDGDDFVYLDINPAGMAMTHLSREEVIGHRITEVFSGADSMGLLDAMRRVYQTGEHEVLENSLYQDDNYTNWFNVHVHKISFDEIVIIYKDLTAEKRTNIILRESEERFRTLFTYTPIGLYRTTREGKILDANQALVDMLGYPSREIFLDKSAFDIFVELEHRLNQIHLLQENDKLQAQEIQVYRFDGSIIWVKDRARAIYDIEGNLSYYLGSLEDITAQVASRNKLQEYSDNLESMIQERTNELKIAQEKLLRQEKLAVLGQLAGGIGHDLRNPLGVISNSTYYLKMVSGDERSEIIDYLDIIDEEVKTANTIVEDLLDFARTREPVKEPIVADKYMEELFHRYPPPENVQVVVDFSNSFPTIWADPNQLYSVFANLIANAYQAMQDGGNLTVRGKNTGEEEVCIEVTDDGVGIPDEFLDHLFEPLFTTKQRGVGLGLLTAKNLVEANQGRIMVDSKKSIGTMISVFLPVWKEYNA